MRRTQIYLDEDQATALAGRARRRGVTASHVIREAIDDYLAEPEDASDRELARFRAALDRSFASAPRLPSSSAYVDQLREADTRRATDLEGSPPALMLLDTTVLIDHLRGIDAARAFLLGLHEVPACSEVSRVEVLQGLRASERAAAENLFGVLTWVPVDESIARRAGEIGRRYRRSHPGLSLADLLIGATALELDVSLATANVRHFPMLRGLRPPY